MKIVLFTVADTEIGLGHFFRCDALAYALMLKNVEVELFVDSATGRDWLITRPHYFPVKVQNWTKQHSLVEQMLDQSDLLIIDSYNVDQRIWQIIKEKKRKVVLFDDFGEKPELEGILINGSPGATSIQYRKTPDRELLLGPEFQVLRPPFWNSNEYSLHTTIHKIGILIGGTDHRNLSTEITTLLLQTIPDSCQIYLIGEVSCNIDVSNVVLTGLIDADGIKMLFNELDFLICGGGQTVAEAVSCSIPTLVLCVAENQQINYQGWANTGAIIPGDDISEISFVDWSKTKETVVMSLDYEIRKKCSSISQLMNLSGSTERVCSRILAL